MNKRAIINAILQHLVRSRSEGADRVYFDALATDDDVTTFGDLVDKLNKPDESSEPSYKHAI